MEHLTARLEPTNVNLDGNKFQTISVEDGTTIACAIVYEFASVLNSHLSRIEGNVPITGPMLSKLVEESAKETLKTSLFDTYKQ